MRPQDAINYVAYILDLSYIQSKPCTFAAAGVDRGPFMIDMSVVELSRWQFALTTMYHFLFVPLTLGLSFLLAVMESVYVMTGR